MKIEIDFEIKKKFRKQLGNHVETEILTSELRHSFLGAVTFKAEKKYCKFFRPDGMQRAQQQQTLVKTELLKN